MAALDGLTGAAEGDAEQLCGLAGGDGGAGPDRQCGHRPSRVLRCPRVHYGHTVLHVDNDFPTVAGVLKEVEQRDART